MQAVSRTNRSTNPRIISHVILQSARSSTPFVWIVSLKSFFNFFGNSPSNGFSRSFVQPPPDWCAPPRFAMMKFLAYSLLAMQNVTAPVRFRKVAVALDPYPFDFVECNLVAVLSRREWFAEHSLVRAAKGKAIHQK